MKFYCPACKAVVKRKPAGWIKSYCGKKGRYVRLQPVRRK